MRPEGSSLWLRWPELGLNLKAKRGSDAVSIGLWRRHRLLNDWPAELVRGRTWPWEGRWENAAPPVEEPMF
jgi:hypothetical protein